MKKEKIISKSSYYEQCLAEYMTSTRELNENIEHHLSGIRDLLIDIQRYLKADTPSNSISIQSPLQIKYKQ